jgi:microcin C transport system substrate-binding protein
VETPDDRSWVIFRLRPQARWQNGTPVTADDVVFSFNTLMEKGHPQYRSYYRDVKEAVKLDARAVKFTFAGHQNRELPLIIGQLPVFSKAYFTTHSFEKTTLEPPMGSGPYKVGKLKAGHFITYVRDPNYWGRDLPLKKGRHNFDRIRYDYYRDDTVAIEGLKAGEYDIRVENVAKVWATAYNDLPALKDGRMVKEMIPHQISTGMQAFVMNTRRPMFQDIRVRQALGLAFDFEWTNKQFFYDAYSRTTSYFSNSPFAAQGIPEGEELAFLTPYKDQLPPALFTQTIEQPKTDGSGNNRPNLREADRLLQEAGWVVKDMKRINPATGKPMEIEFLLQRPMFERVIAPMIRNLERLGIKGRIRTVDTAQYQKRLDTFDFDMVVYVFSQSNSPGNEQMDFWHSARANVEGSRNIIGIQHPVVDALVEKIVGAHSRPELVAATRALDRVLLWQYYVIPNWHLQSFRMIYWNKFGKPKVAPPYGLALDTWWFKQ